MFFPKDSTVWLAAWAIHQNEDEYKDHHTFNPDRFRYHTKLANEYAVSADWENRDKFAP
jgi:cytochrome P450